MLCTVMVSKRFSKRNTNLSMPHPTQPYKAEITSWQWPEKFFVPDMVSGRYGGAGKTWMQDTGARKTSGSDG